MKRIKKCLKRLSEGPLKPLFFCIWSVLTWIYIGALRVKWFVSSAPKPNASQQKLVCDNVTFIYKSFERQKMAKRLYHNLQKYYPGVRVIIADDSRKPLDLHGPGLQVIQLPFNSGLSKGLNAALKQVQTPFTIRLDDDELLSPCSNFHGQLEFLLAYPQVDLVGILPRNIPMGRDWKSNAQQYYRFSMRDAPDTLMIPHGTNMDSNHVVLGKVPNIFIVRTEKYKKLGYDDNIRMIDHHEFFYRAAGKIVSVLDTSCYVLHYHNPFHKFYQQYRMAIQGDLKYIRAKRESAPKRAEAVRKESSTAADA